MSTSNELPVPPPKDPVIEVLMKDVDRTLLRENLKLTPDERARRLVKLLEAAEEFARAGRNLENTS